MVPSEEKPSAGRQHRSGPLVGLRVVEIGGIGPAPFAGMMLADMGADVVVVDRVEDVERQDPNAAILRRGRRSIALDLKQPDAVDVLLQLVGNADMLIEPFRPGVAERLGFGPDVCFDRNPRLVYGRMTGWGQTGPLAERAGHDINYIALSGALGAIGGTQPVVPLNLVGDFGGGALYLLFGVLCALFEAARSGRGQVVDAAMVDGAASLTTFFHGLLQAGAWRDQRGANFLDGAAWFYDTYETSDHEYVCFGAIEPAFRRELTDRLGIARDSLPKQWDEATWPEMKQRIAEVVATRTRIEWCAVFEGADACFAPVLSLGEAPDHPHNRARSVFIDIDGVVQPAPAPRLSRTPGAVARPPCLPGEDTDEVLADWLDFDASRLRTLSAVGAVRQHPSEDTR